MVCEECGYKTVLAVACDGNVTKLCNVIVACGVMLQRCVSWLWLVGSDVTKLC